MNIHFVEIFKLERNHLKSVLAHTNFGEKAVQNIVIEQKKGHAIISSI